MACDCNCHVHMPPELQSSSTCLVCCCGPASYNEVVEALSKACDVAVWMSGSPSFSPEGEASEGWIERARPSLYAALAVLERTWGDVPG